MITTQQKTTAPFITIVTVLASMLWMVGCTSQESPQEQAAPSAAVQGDTLVLQSAQLAQLRVATATITQTQISSPLRASGTIDVAPQHRAVVSSPIGGTIARIHVQAGQQVAAGAALLTVEHRDVVTMQQDYLTTVASLTAAQSELARQERLAQDQVNARKVVEQLTADVTGMRVRVSALREQLALIGINAATLRESSITRSITLRAPVAGYVTDVRTSLGAYVQPQDVLVSVVNTATMYADLVVYERDAAYVAEGQDVVIRSISDTTAISGRIRLVGRAVGADRAIRATVALTSPTSGLRPGMAVNGTIRTAPRTAVGVPSSSIVQWQGTSYLFTRHADGTFVRHTVTAGTTDNAITEVLGSAATSLLGQQVVTSGATGLLGAMVNTGE